MRIRTIKPEFWTHPVMSAQPAETQLLAIALLNVADDEGYFYADPDLIRGAVRPRENSLNVHGALTELSNIGYIELREHSTHGLLGRVAKFDEHQRVNRPSTSSIKELWAHGTFTERSLNAHCGKGKERKGKDMKVSTTTSPTPSPPSRRISWLAGDGWSGIEDSDRDRWSKAYPALDLDRQLAAADAWLDANPKKAVKSNWARFLTNWFSRQQDQGGDVKSNGRNGSARAHEDSAARIQLRSL
jgi:hypothetical protein